MPGLHDSSCETVQEWKTRDRVVRAVLLPRPSWEHSHAICTDPIVSLQNHCRHLPGRVKFPQHPLRILITGLAPQSVAKVAKRVTLSGWPLGGINHCGTAAMVFMTLPGRGPSHVEVFDGPGQVRMSFPFGPLREASPMTLGHGPIIPCGDTQAGKTM